MRKHITIALFFVLSTCQVIGQNLYFDLDTAQNTYIKGSLSGQVWFRMAELNPGSEINGKNRERLTDVSMRRYRASIQSQITPRIFFYSIIGQNNINSANKQFKPELLDLTIEYAFHKSFELGMGQSSWGGPSRWTVRSSAMMALDAPLFSLFTVNKNDQLGRLPGIFAKGQVNKFDYVVTIQKPYKYDEAVKSTAFYAPGEEKLRSSAYVKYEIIGDESNKTSYSGGKSTYFGQEEILNIGGGVLYQPDMMASSRNNNLQYHDFKAWAVEAFLDRQVSFMKNGSVTVYMGYFNTQFGPDYIRNLGANDVASAGSNFNGSGMDFPMMGTGSTIFGQFGVYKQIGEVSNRGIQPNIAVQYSSFDRLADPVIVYDLGINMYLVGQSQKLTLAYQSRPQFYDSDNLIKTKERCGSWIIQYQFILK